MAGVQGGTWLMPVLSYELMNEGHMGLDIDSLRGVTKNSLSSFFFFVFFKFLISFFLPSSHYCYAPSLQNTFLVYFITLLFY